MPAYSRILLPWDTQPQEPAGVDWEDPKNAGTLIAANYAFPEYEAARGGIATNTRARTIGPQGKAIGGTSGLVTYQSTTELEAATNGFAPRAVIFLLATTTTGNTVIAEKGTNSGIVCQTLSSKFTFRTAGTGTSSVSTTSNITSGLPVVVAASYDATGHQKVYFNGVLEAENDIASAASNTSPLVVGARVGNVAPFPGDIYFFQFLNRAPSDAEIFARSKEIWTAFTPRSIWVPVSAGGGGTSISGALGTAVASGFTGTVNANRSIAGALGTATASGFTGTVSNSTNTAITGAPGVAAASGFKGTVGANRGIAGALGVAVASGFTGAVTNDNSTTIAGALGTATASGFTGAITWNRYISGLLGVAQASGFAGGVQNGAAPVIATGGGIYPTPRRKTKQEIDKDRKRLGILPDGPEVQTGIVEGPKRPKITLEQLIGKPAADTHRADMERASAAHKLRKRRQDDDLLMMM